MCLILYPWLSGAVTGSIRENINNRLGFSFLFCQLINTNDYDTDASRRDTIFSPMMIYLRHF